MEESEVNESYLDYVLELNKKVTFAKQDATTMTSACADIAPELEKLRLKSVQKIRDFLLGRVASLKKKFTNIQILQQSVLLKYTGLYRFLQDHAPEIAVEIKVRPGRVGAVAGVRGRRGAGRRRKTAAPITNQ